MDSLRTCYGTWMRLFRDSDALTWCEWQYASVNAIPYDGVHRFGSLRWFDRPTEPSDLGEQALEPRPRVRPVVSAHSGTAQPDGLAQGFSIQDVWNVPMVGPCGDVANNAPCPYFGLARLVTIDTATEIATAVIDIQSVPWTWSVLAEDGLTYAGEIAWTSTTDPMAFVFTASGGTQTAGPLGWGVFHGCGNMLNGEADLVGMDGDGLYEGIRLQIITEAPPKWWHK